MIYPHIACETIKKTNPPLVISCDEFRTTNDRWPFRPLNERGLINISGEGRVECPRSNISEYFYSFLDRSTRS